MTKPDVNDVKISLQHFDWPDYLVFAFMLISCSLIGVYFGFIERKSKKLGDEEANYLVGGRQMGVVPISLSLIASFISGISLLGIPTEIYVYGIQYTFGAISAGITTGLAMTYVFLPVFHDLKLTSTYEYLQTRFDKRMRLFGSIMFSLAMLVWLPIVIYVPALAFNQVTGINVHLVTPVVCIVCIFYTSVGGLKAVVWTDVVQVGLMIGAILLIVIKGTYDIGGPGIVWHRAVASDRIELPDISFDLKTRHTVWSMVIGGFVNSLKSHAISQNMIQRYLSLPTLRSAKQALWFFIGGTMTLNLLCTYSGLLIYARYFDCDPLTTGLAKAKDQLLPLLVMQTFDKYPGLTGLFVAGVFSAALSSLSTGLNSMSAVVLHDFIRTFSSRPITDRQSRYIMRGVAAVFGTVCTCLVLVVEHLGTVLQLAISLSSIVNGPLLGVFTMAVMVPWVHGTGAIIGGVTGLTVMAWICIKAQADIASGALTFATKPVDTAECAYEFAAASSKSMSMWTVNVTQSLADYSASVPVHHMSYLWYTLCGSTITIVVALIASFALGANNPKDLDAKLLAPFVRRMIWGKSDDVVSDSFGDEVVKENGLKADGFNLEEVSDGENMKKRSSI